MIRNARRRPGAVEYPSSARPARAAARSGPPGAGKWLSRYRLVQRLRGNSFCSCGLLGEDSNLFLGLSLILRKRYPFANDLSPRLVKFRIRAPSAYEGRLMRVTYRRKSPSPLFQSRLIELAVSNRLLPPQLQVRGPGKRYWRRASTKLLHRWMADSCEHRYHQISY